MSKCNWGRPDEKREYDKAKAAENRQRYPEKAREATQKWRLKNPRQLMDPLLKHRVMREAALMRWQNPEKRAKIEADRRQRCLKKDLKILDWVMRGIRYKLELPGKQRVRALADYHADSEGFNRRRQLREAFRKVLRRAERNSRKEILEKPTRPALLEKAFRRVLVRASNRAEQKIRKRLCSRFERVMKGKGRAITIVGATLAVVRAHLEAQFLPGMTWSNHGYGPGFWNIDHIRPLASFKLSDPQQVKLAFHFTNLQPLWHEVNMAKRDHF